MDQISENQELDVTALLKKTYNLDATAISKLTGYDDINYVVECHNFETEQINKYVLKIINVTDSNRPNLTEGIMAVLDKLPLMSYQIPKPFRCTNGSLVGQVQIDGALRKIILLTFVPGLNSGHLNLTSEGLINLCQDVGLCAGTLSSYLYKLPLTTISPLPSRPDEIYMTENIHLSRHKLEIIEDQQVRDICSAVMDIVKGMSTLNPPLRKGLIHHDLCIENLIFSRDKSTMRYNVVGAIDFSDMTYGYCLFDAAIPIASVMYESFTLKQVSYYDAAKSVLLSYQKCFPLTVPEKKFLYYAVLARFVSLRVLGGYDVLHSPATAEHEQHESEPLEYFIRSLWVNGHQEFNDNILSNT